MRVWRLLGAIVFGATGTLNAQEARANEEVKAEQRATARPSIVTLPHMWLAARTIAAAAAVDLQSIDRPGEWARCSRIARPASGFDRRLTVLAYDGVCLPRYQQHALKIFIASTVADLTQEVTGLSERKSAAISAIAVGVAPHLLGYARKTIKFDAGDWAADAWMGSFPLMRTVDLPVLGKVGGVTLWLGVYSTVYPYASP